MESVPQGFQLALKLSNAPGESFLLQCCLIAFSLHLRSNDFAITERAFGEWRPNGQARAIPGSTISSTAGGEGGRGGSKPPPRSPAYPWQRPRNEEKRASKSGQTPKTPVYSKSIELNRKCKDFLITTLRQQQTLNRGPRSLGNPITPRLSVSFFF